MIQSYLIANAADGVQYLFYDTVLDGKHVFTACGIGKVANNDVLLTQVARETLLAAVNHANDSNSGSFNTRFQEIGVLRGVEARIGQALDAANDKDLIFFVCKTPDIYDAAVANLYVQWLLPGAMQ